MTSERMTWGRGIRDRKLSWSAGLFVAAGLTFLGLHGLERSASADDAKPAATQPAAEAKAGGGDDLLSADSAPATKPAATQSAEDDLLSGGGGKGGGDDLLQDDHSGSLGKPAMRSVQAVKGEPDHEKVGVKKGVDPHAEVFATDRYPSAAKCATCHQQIYDEWASSNHAYASISPMFHKFEQRINDLAQGTVGYFCVRCHASVGTTMGEERWKPLWERVPVAREGVTCITCHRVKEEYNKVNGERRIEPGPIYDPMYGSIGGGGVAAVVGDPAQWKVKTSKTDSNPGMDIHRSGIKFEQIEKSEFCVSCHQVAVYPGIKLEVVWDQYRASPAFRAGVTCQACHMGTIPGRSEGGFATAASAVINGKPVNANRSHGNHAFYGPGYPIAHPGIFPQNPRNTQFTIDTWLKFDYRAGWGSKEWEDKASKDYKFPTEWADRFDRETAREIVEENLKKLEYKRSLRRQVMENGSHVDGPFFTSSIASGKKLSFYYNYRNINPGHNLPSGSLGAQPEIWINVALTGPDGKNVWESGYVDSGGDMCDIHSADAGQGKIPYDDQLINLQTKFLITGVKGTDREMFLPVNVDIDQLPFIRPAGQPITVLNHPPFIRMEGRSIPPLGVKKCEYSVPGKLMSKPGTYKLSFRVRSRAEPIYFMKFCGATKDMLQTMNEWMIDIHPYTVAFEVK